MIEYILFKNSLAYLSHLKIEKSFSFQQREIDCDTVYSEM